MKSRIALITAIGSGLEYYDFVIYALAAPYISQSFFPSHTPWLNLLSTLLIFASGYIVRPLGGLFFGSMGDRLGRKKSFTASILLMSLATLAIACLPSYSSWGIFSSIGLALCRVTQGIAQGAELPGALTFIYEHASESKRSFTTSLVTSGVGIGSMFGALVFFILHQNFNALQMQAFAWRIAFFIGGSVALFSYLLRRYTSESPLFNAMPSEISHQPIKHLLRFHWRHVLAGIGFTLFTSSFIIYFLFLPNYLHQYFNYDTAEVYFVTTIGLAWSALLIPFMGYISDKLGPFRLLSHTTALLAISLPFAFFILSYQNKLALYGFVFFYQTSIATIAACIPYMLASLFPTKVRYTGTALTYNTAFAFAGFTPLIAAYLIHQFKTPYIIPVFLSALAVVSSYASRQSLRVEL